MTNTVPLKEFSRAESAAKESLVRQGTPVGSGPRPGTSGEAASCDSAPRDSAARESGLRGLGGRTGGTWVVPELRRRDAPEGSLGEERGGSPGVHAALSALEALVSRGPLGLTELAAEVGVAKSTLHRVGAVLVKRGWAIRRSDGRFDLGIRAIGIGSRSAELPLITAFRTTAADLLTRHNETVCLAVVDGDESVYIALEETTHPVRLVTNVGSRTPAFASASGRVILANRTDDAVAAQFGGRALETPTGRRLHGVDELLRAIAQVRSEGFAFNDEDTAVGLYALSAPIRNGAGVVLAALTVCVPTSRLDAVRRVALVSDLKAAAGQLSASVSWLPSWSATRADQRIRLGA